MWDFFNTQINRIAALAESFHHVDTDLIAAKPNSCLLSPCASDFVFAEGIIAQTSGSCFHRSKRGGHIVRSGKTVRTGMGLETSSTQGMQNSSPVMIWTMARICNFMVRISEIGTNSC